MLCHAQPLLAASHVVLGRIKFHIILYILGVCIEEQQDQSIPECPEPTSWAWSEIEDPTVRMAYALGMDPKVLPMFTGKVTGNSIGTVNALKFALSHPLAPSTDGEQVIMKNYMKLTRTAAIKKELTHIPMKPKMNVELPVTPTTTKIQSIEGVLDSMKSRLMVRRYQSYHINTRLLKRNTHHSWSSFTLHRAPKQQLFIPWACSTLVKSAEMYSVNLKLYAGC